MCRFAWLALYNRLLGMIAAAKVFSIKHLEMRLFHHGRTSTTKSQSAQLMIPIGFKNEIENILILYFYIDWIRWLKFVKKKLKHLFREWIRIPRYSGRKTLPLYLDHPCYKTMVEDSETWRGPDLYQVFRTRWGMGTYLWSTEPAWQQHQSHVPYFTCTLRLAVTS